MKVEAEITKRFDETGTKPGKLVAFAKFTLEDAFVVHNVQVLQKEDGTLRVAMPPQRRPDGSIVTDVEGFWRETCHPVNAETRKAIVDAVLEAMLY